MKGLIKQGNSELEIQFKNREISYSNIMVTCLYFPLITFINYMYYKIIK